MSRIDPTHDSDRGQAYTLEGFISAMVVLMAILLALQSVVITPTTGGLADRTVQSQVQQETQDALVVAAAADDGDLSAMVRHWNDSEEEFHNASESDDVPGYYNASNQTELYDEFVLGEILSDRFTERGMSYNIELVYQDQDGEFDTDTSTYLVYQGESEAVTASYMVTLFDDQELEDGTELGEENHDYPIPRATDGDSKVYNVVEVRVAVW
ncbi:DUF7288 family protein [Natronorubrum sulfidifaciens]|uniref:Uncharacterized protein n=1 Tax=Natronorubrum sulfidifaciens JCM 14089 TaxID=1230460 RepID=L9W4T2_9EURY|nr:hypothetical protein [Natronorubrum sulfidifaciens]ELY44460.1 hypothetical protein C495_11174 [Natronorubrum sulfidifaciens JCM 14089]